MLIVFIVLVIIGLICLNIYYPRYRIKEETFYIGGGKTQTRYYVQSRNLIVWNYEYNDSIFGQSGPSWFENLEAAEKELEYKKSFISKVKKYY